MNKFCRVLLLSALFITASFPSIAQVANGRATTAAPSYPNNTTAPLSLDTSGALRTSTAITGAQSNASDNVATSADNLKSVSWLYGFDGAAWDRVTVTGGAINVAGTFWQATQPVSGTFWQATQPVSGPLTDTQLRATPVPISGALTANQSVNLAQVAGTNTVNGGLAGSVSVGGTVATNVAISANPLNLGAQAVSSENTAVTTARQVQLVADLVGKLIVLPYSNPENFVSGVITSAMTGTTSTSLVAAPAGSLRNYITACTFSNAHATVGTDMILQDGSGGTTIWNIPAAAVYGGAHITFPTPLRQPTAATALYVQNVTTGASTKAACSGYKGV